VFSPLDLNPELWLDAADTTTITESSGLVSQWDDKSGNARNFTQGTAGNQPTTGTVTLNGFNVLSFDGDDVLVGGTSPSLFASNTNPFEIFVVGRTTLDNTGTFVSQNILASEGARQFQLLRAGAPDNSVAVVARGVITRVNRSPRFDRDAVFNFRRDTSVATLADGNTTTSATIGTASEELTALIKIGARSNGTTTSNAFFVNGRIGEVIIYSRSLSSTERSKVNSYFANKWGITL
jgi:hypothetical protein